MWPIEKLYERPFGWIATERIPKVKPNKRASWLAVGVLTALSMSISFLYEARPVVSALGLYIALGVFMGWGRRSERRHLLGLGILLVAMSLAPLIDISLYPSVTVRDASIKLVMAVGILTVGTIDHLTLVRTLGPIRQEEEIRA